MLQLNYFTAFCYEKIKQGLPNAKIKDSERLVNWVRLVKSDTEISKNSGWIKEVSIENDSIFNEEKTNIFIHY